MNFKIDNLAQAIQTACPQVIFALLHGSAKDGTIHPGSDLDVALYVEGRPTFDIYTKASEAVEAAVPDVTPDIGILNNAEPIYRFEALKGRLLFCIDREVYVSFFSQTCRDYEMQMADYQRQHRYRLQAAQI